MVLGGPSFLVVPRGVLVVPYGARFSFSSLWLLVTSGFGGSLSLVVRFGSWFLVVPLSLWFLVVTGAGGFLVPGDSWWFPFRFLEIT